MSIVTIQAEPLQLTSSRIIKIKKCQLYCNDLGWTITIDLSLNKNIHSNSQL